jgi:hypothetical protein
MTQLFLSPSGHFGVLKEDIVSTEDMKLVKLLRENNPVIVTISDYYVPEAVIE